jgi:hypothetical protein
MPIDMQKNMSFPIWRILRRLRTEAHPLSTLNFKAGRPTSNHRVFFVFYIFFVLKFYVSILFKNEQLLNFEYFLKMVFLKSE